jgi:hypothetical protein
VTTHFGGEQRFSLSSPWRFSSALSERIRR